MFVCLFLHFSHVLRLCRRQIKGMDKAVRFVVLLALAENLGTVHKMGALPECKMQELRGRVGFHRFQSSEKPSKEHPKGQCVKLQRQSQRYSGDAEKLEMSCRLQSAKLLDCPSPLEHICNY